MSEYTTHDDFGTPDFDPQRAFGATDPRFAARVQTTLEELQKQETAPVAHGPQNQEAAVAAVAHEPRPPRRRTRWVVLAAAAIFVILSFGTAFAATNGFGLLDRINNVNAGPTLPEAQDLVVSGPAQQGGVFPQATFTLDEFIYDGETLWVSVTARPSDPQYVLTHGNETLAQDAKKLVNEQDVPMDQTLSSWAIENGYTPFSAAVHLKDDNGFSFDGFTMQFLDDGSVAYVIAASGTPLGPDQELSLVCTLSPYLPSEGRFDFENREETTLNFTIGEIPQLPSVASSQPIEFATAGIVVDYVKLTSSPLTTYCELEFAIADTELFTSYNGGLLIRVLDIDGQQYLSGLGGGSLGPIPGDESRYRFHSAIQAMEKLPSEIQLQLFDLNNGKQTVETQSVSLS